MRIDLKLVVVAVSALALASCGRSEEAKTPESPAASTAAQVEPDPSPKNIGAVTAQYQTAGDAILDDTRVRDVVFVLDGRGATIEALVRATDEPFRAQLINNEGRVLQEADVALGQEVRLSGQGTGGNRNMIRLIRQVPRSAPARFNIRIRTIREAN